MPVFILLDRSLGMAQNRYVSDGTLDSLFGFARRLVTQILEHLREKNPLEVVQLFLFSSDIEPFCELIRDTECIPQALMNFTNFTSKAQLDVAIEHIKSIVEKGVIGNSKNLLYDVIVISRGEVLSDHRSFRDIQEHLPLPQHCYFHYVCCDPLFGSFQTEIVQKFNALQAFFNINKIDDCKKNGIENGSSPLQTLSLNNKSTFSTPIIPTSPFRDADSIGCIVTGGNEMDIKQKLAAVLKKYFVPLPLQMFCGTLSSRLSLFPTVPNTEAFKSHINLHGFLPCSDISNCIILSKHLIQPIPDTIGQVLQKNSIVWPKSVLNYDSIQREFDTPTKVPNFCVLLKKSLIKNKCAAICTIDNAVSSFVSGSNEGKSTIGYIMPQADEAANLQLCLLDKLPDWIDGLNTSTLKNVSEISPPKKIDSSRAILLHESIVQTDIAKVFRYARRLPDRRDAVLAEMDKFIKLVRSCYFQGLGITLVAILERELLQPDTKADHLIQIISELKLELGL